MKRFVYFFSALLAVALIAGCKPKIVAVDITVQLYSDNAPLALEGVPVSLADAAGTATFDAVTDAAGAAAFTVNPGSYTASATYKTVEDGKRMVYNGSNASILVAEQPAGAFKLELQKVESQQLIIKELHTGGSVKDDGSGAYYNDKYIIIYNNSEFEADASDLVIGILNPYNAQSNTNAYYTGDVLLYANDSWLPAGGAIWYVNSTVKIPAYSQIVIAVFGAIDHTATVKASVDLSKPEYYWMSNNDVPAYTNKKYTVADGIPTSHYLSGYAINMGNAWVLSNTSPALFIGKMDKGQLNALCTNTEAFDLTCGSNNISWAVKFPKANVIGGLEVYAAASLDACHKRFSADVNTGYVALTNALGYTIYRNVDKEATEALPENEGKLVYNYAGGTQDAGGTTDPSGIDAEASIAAGAHIIYSQTNDSGKDFHQRKIASLK